MNVPLAKVVAAAVTVAVLGTHPSEVARAAGDVTYLNQGWTTEDRLAYYFTSQGSAALPYDLMLHLEEANSTDLLRSDRVLSGFGLIPQAADPKYNPDGLPIGIERTVVTEGQWRGEWAGLTCAACHNGQLEYQGRRIRIDGGNSMLDFGALIAGIDAALAKPLADAAAFDRLAARLGIAEPAARDALRARLEPASAEVHYYRTRTALELVPGGPGRNDALGLIANRMSVNMVGVPENWNAPLAPTKYPFVWNASQSSWVQWTGVASQPLSRNVGEVVGVFGKVGKNSDPSRSTRFATTADLQGMITIENLLRRLAPPKWPEEIFGPIDQAKAAAGKELFVATCAECHSVYPHRWSAPKLQGKRFIENALVPLDIVGTDPMQFRSPQFDPLPTKITGALAPYLEPPHTNAILVPNGAFSRAFKNAILEAKLPELGLTDAESLSVVDGFRRADEAPPVQPVYKAGPRDGSWATAPFLHNGSVPNLYELLVPAAERSKTFMVGGDFDPVKVGVDTSGATGRFLYDTTLIGNSNAGHSFQDGPAAKGVIGRKLAEGERWALIEYLKSIPTEDAQITPYGGPANPVDAWTDPTFFHARHQAIYDGN